MPTKTIRLYLFFATLTKLALSCIAATYATFLISRGLNLFQINLANLVFATTLFVCEIPTGAVADVFGRKTSFVISCLVLSASMFIYSVGHTFWGFALAEVVGAVGMTFATGAFRAWLVDKIRHEGYTGSVNTIFVREAQLAGIFGIGGAIAGARLADHDGRLPWLFGGALLLIAGVLAQLLLSEEYFVRQKFQLRGSLSALAGTIGRSVGKCKTNKVLRFVLIIGVVQYFAVQGPNMQWQTFFLSFLHSKANLGYVFAGISLALVLGSMCSRRLLLHCAHESRAILVAEIAIGLGIVLVPFFTSLPWALGVFMAHEVARGVIGPLKDVYLNDNIPSQERATLLSFEGMAQHVGGMLGLLVSGVVAQYVSIGASWALSGGVLVLVALVLGRRRVS